MNSTLPPALDRAIIADAEERVNGAGGGDILVLDDESGALTEWALSTLTPASDTRDQEHATAAAAPRVLVRCRSYAEATAIARRAAEAGAHARARILIAGIDSHTLSLEEFLSDTKFSGRLVIGRLPKALNAVDDWARALARHSETCASAIEEFILGGNTKHMSRSTNIVLNASFTSVTALRGRGKFRCLSARGPRKNIASHDGTGKGPLNGTGGVFSGGKPDRGGEALAAAAQDWIASRHIAPGALRVLDLGCGNGLLSHRLLANTAVAGALASLTATDIDADAVRSTRATLNDAPYDSDVTWDESASQTPSDSIDLVLLNPPFHEGTRVDATLVEPLLDAAARVLAPGGTLLFVHNSHLRYRAELESRFAQVTQVSRDRTFTVLCAQA